jgi:hypothetical protein
VPETASPETAAADDALLRALRTHKLPCPHCHYDLRHAISLRCPECGRQVEASAFRVGKVFPKSHLLVWSIVGACVWLVMSPAALIWLRVQFDTPPRAVALLLFVLLSGGAAWLCWSLAYRPLAWLNRPPAVKTALWIVVVAPGAIVLMLMLGLSVFVVWNALRIVL